MSIEQTDVVDIVSTERMSGNVVLTVSDHLDWSDSTAHQLLLQSKLNRYLAFVESGEILESYPKAKDRPIVFNVVFKFPPDDAGREFLAKSEADHRVCWFHPAGRNIHRRALQLVTNTNNTKAGRVRKRRNDPHPALRRRCLEPQSRAS